MLEIAKKLEVLKLEGIAEVLSLSSVGPGFFVLTEQPEICKKHFERAGLTVYTAKPYNQSYQVTQTTPL